VLQASAEPVPSGRPLELSEVVTLHGETDGKDSEMWVFDGDEWIQDNGGVEPVAKPGTERPRYDQRMPELQVIEVEIVPRPTRERHVPLLPIP
jgi:hypothetical protein